MKKQMCEEATAKMISSNAVKLYEEAQNEYHKKSLIGKAAALFTGKKPKKNMTNDEIQQQYGPEAEYQYHTRVIETKISQLEEQRRQEIEWYQQKENPEQYQTTIQVINRQYDREIEKLKEELEMHKSQGRSK